MPAWMTPLLRPVWCAPRRCSRSSRQRLAPGWRASSSRATASPTMPPPTTTRSQLVGAPPVSALTRPILDASPATRWPAAARTVHGRRIGPMALPLKPPVKPQLALSRKALPEGDELGATSRSTTASARSPSSTATRSTSNPAAAGRCAATSRSCASRRGATWLDGELVILGEDGREEFDALQNRLHPAESRVRMLAEQTPARFRVFDLLAVDGRKLLKKPFRRAARAAQDRGDGRPAPAPQRVRRDHAARLLAGEGRAMARLRRGRDRQAARRRLPARRAQGHGQGQAGADDRLRRSSAGGPARTRAPSAR